MADKTLPIVSFEQAQKLKKLGFDWIKDVGYNKQGNLIGRDVCVTRCYICRLQSSFVCSAPSVALALKWFRDEKGKATTIRYYDNFYYRNQDDSKNPSKYSTFEEAETALLDALIELELKKEDSDVI
ncbi:MAG: hypothetical protein FWG85_08175 [Bacteroidetes bacterium]|nr:hypothetical protein [Bacteroidota bacterium]